MAEIKRGQLFVEAIWHNGEYDYVLALVDLKGGRVLETSRALNEQEARKVLAEDYNEPDDIIEQRLSVARNALMAPDRAKP